MVRFSLAAAFLLCLGGGPGFADPATVPPAHARAAVQAGLVRPLQTLLRVIEARYAGQVVEAELREDARQFVYEFVLVPANGRMFSVYLDAATGEVVRTRGTVQEKH